MSRLEQNQVSHRLIQDPTGRRQAPTGVVIEPSTELRTELRTEMQTATRIGIPIVTPIEMATVTNEKDDSSVAADAAATDSAMV